nr:YthC [Bacillus subtilis]
MAWSRKFYVRSTTVLIGAKVTNAPLMPFMLSAILVKRLKTAGKQTAKRLSRMIYN